MTYSNSSRIIIFERYMGTFYFNKTTRTTFYYIYTTFTTYIKLHFYAFFLYTNMVL